MAMIHREPLVSLRVQTGTADATTTTLLMVHPTVFFFGNTKTLLPVFDDPARFALGVQTPRSVLLVELRQRLCCVTA